MLKAYVHLEIKRIQTYLFSVPKLKAMLGANTILGETLMGSIEDLNVTKSTPAVNLVQLAMCFELSPIRVQIDLESRLKNEENYPDDDPMKFAEKGIISRNGGHFSACFRCDESAKQFITAARDLIARKLPGSIVHANLIPEESIASGNSGEQVPVQTAVALAEIPQFASCSGSGNDPASLWSTKNKPISKSFSEKIKAADRFYKGESHDAIAKLLNPKRTGHGKISEYSFEQLCGNDYLAVIHADGNCMGELSQEYIKDNRMGLEIREPWEKFLYDELLRESFFYAMRRCVRNALASTLKKVFKIDTPTDELNNYFRVLMLGGDDLLLACRAAYAFPFIIEYAKQIEKYAADYGIEFSIGAGIGIANKKKPFNRMHELAEELASRAKKMRMYQLKKRVSVVDWVISTESQLDSLSRITKRHWQYQLADCSYFLTMRPYRIIGEGVSLETIFELAQKLQKDEISRNQYKRFILKLQDGCLNAHVAYAELPKLLQNIFDEMKNKLEDKDKKRTLSLFPFIQFSGSSAYYTNIPDLVELAEISHLPSKIDSEQKETSGVHDETV